MFVENKRTVDRVALEQGSTVTFCLCSYHKDNLFQSVVR